MIVDYYYVQKKELNTNDLYNINGQYSYVNGFNLVAVFALLCGILPNVPGFLLNIKVVSEDAFPTWVLHLYNYAWFVGFIVSGILYFMLMKKSTSNIE